VKFAGSTNDVCQCEWLCMCVCVYTLTHTLASNNKNKKLRELGWRGCVFLGGWVFELKVNTFRWRVMCSSLFLSPIYTSLSLSLFLHVCECGSEGTVFNYDSWVQDPLTTNDIPWLLFLPFCKAKSFQLCNDCVWQFADWL